MPAVESKKARDVVMGRQICLLHGTGSNQSASRVRERQLIVTGSETRLRNPGQIERYLALDLQGQSFHANDLPCDLGQIIALLNLIRHHQG